MYKGQLVQLPDGTTIQKGDAIAEMHINNTVVARVAQVSRWLILSTMKDELRAAARWLTEGEGSDVKALYGETAVSRTTTWLGFTLLPGRPTLMGRLRQLYSSGLVQIYSPGGSERLTRGSQGIKVPDEVWMSRAELLRRYGGGEK